MSELEQSYRARYENILMPLAEALRVHFAEHLAGQPRIDRISARAKSPDRFIEKARKEIEGQPKYTDPLRQIQDQVGVRIVTFYESDVTVIGNLIDKYYRPIETQVVVPDSVWEFGYFGRHSILIVPPDVVDQAFDQASMPEFFELQIKTLFQHAWSEAEHDLGYKPVSSLDLDAKRRLAFTSAQAWGADQMFNDLFKQHGLAPEGDLENSS